MSSRPPPPPIPKPLRAAEPPVIPQRRNKTTRPRFAPWVAAFLLCVTIAAVAGAAGFWLGNWKQKSSNAEVPSSDSRKTRAASASRIRAPAMTEQSSVESATRSTSGEPITAPASPPPVQIKHEPPAMPDTIASASPPQSNPAVDALPQVQITTGEPAKVTTESSAAKEQVTQAESAGQGRTIFQTIEIIRRPRFSVQGFETAQEIHYQLMSRIDIDPLVDKRRKVVQFVEDTRLLAADDLSRGTFAKSLERLKRQQYSYTLNERGEVISFTGHKDNLATLAVDLTSISGFAMTSVIDEDGWKELAELTFLVPDPQASPNRPWKRQMTHDWGALGNWSGMTTFSPRGKVKGIQQIDYKHEMKYSRGEGDGSSLPFKIQNARFEPLRAGGKVDFDVERKRVRMAQETFEVRGEVVAELLGQPVEIQLAEQQLIEIRVHDQRPSPNSRN